MDVAAADTALTRALHEGVEHLGHDQSAALLDQLRVLTAKADALTLALVGRVDADGTYALDGALTAGAWLRAIGHQSPGRPPARCGPPAPCAPGCCPTPRRRWPPGRSPAGTPRRSPTASPTPPPVPSR